MRRLLRVAVGLICAVAMAVWAGIVSAGSAEAAPRAEVRSWHCYYAVWNCQGVPGRVFGASCHSLGLGDRAVIVGDWADRGPFVCQSITEVGGSSSGANEEGTGCVYDRFALLPGQGDCGPTDALRSVQAVPGRVYAGRL